MKTLAGAVLALLVLPATAPAQQPPAVPRTKASVELILFNLDVVVTDPSGDPVHGLVAEDFEVLHGGKPVKLTNFHEVRGSGVGVSVAPAGAPAPPSPPAEAAPAPRPRRRLVLFFDRLQIPDPERREALFDSLRRLLAETLEAQDEAMIVTWNQSIETVLPFTGDLSKLEKALEPVQRRSARVPSETADIQMLQDEDAWFKELAADPRIGPEGAGAGFQPTAELYASQAYFEMKAKTSALKGLAATLGGMEGRKVLVLVSHRFSRYAGLEFFLSSRTDVSALGNPVTKQFDAKTMLDDVARAANANGVTLYSLYPEGTDSRLPSAADPRTDNPSLQGGTLGGREQLVLGNELEALSLVAERTGGVVAAGAGAISTFVDRVSSDLDSWYSLGYPSPGNAGKAADVKVRVKGRKLNVRVRGSLVEKTTEEQMRDRVLAHLFRPDERAKIPVAVTATVASSAKGRFRIALDVKVPIGSLALLPTATGFSGAFSVLVAAVGPKGDFSDVARQRRPFEILAADVEKAKAGHFTYLLEVGSSGPDARICVGVWDEVGGDAGFRVVRPSGPGAPPAG